MISLDVNIDDMKKYLKSKDVERINHLLSNTNNIVANTNNIVGQCRIVMGDIEDYYAILSIIVHDIESADEILFIKENITFELFQIQMLKELNKLATKSDRKIKARIEGIN